MPHWTDQPPERDGERPFTLMRVAPGKPIQGVITCDRLIGCNTHYWRRRTVPCNGPSCEPCSEGAGVRWHAYVSLWNPRTGSHVILELTALAAETLVGYQANHGRLRGCELTARRADSRPNSPVNCICKPADVTSLALPAPPDVEAVMCRIWDIPHPSNTNGRRTPLHVA